MKFLKNNQGKQIPKELVDKIEKARFFNQGFATVEFLASGIVDMKLHLATDKKIDTRDFEIKALKEIGMPSEIVMRHRLPHFSHLFSDEGYASGYYGYLWAQVLDCDAFEAFAETGNAFDTNTAEKFRLNIMSIGNTVEPGQAYRNFRGRDAKVDALLRFKGFK
jgi:peptidyl-dipeptidase Dcp